MNVEALKHLRRKKGITQKELAEKTGLSRSFISQIEKRISNPSKDTEYKIAKALGVPVAHLNLSKDMQDNHRLIRLLIDCTLQNKIEWEKLDFNYKGESIEVYRAKSKTKDKLGEININIGSEFLMMYLRGFSDKSDYEEIQLNIDNNLVEVPRLIEVITDERRSFLRQIINELKELNEGVKHD